MKLLERAQRYLAKLERVDRVPTETVVDLISDTGNPVFQPWVEFHDRYAGYVEPLGRGDTAVLGLAQVAHHSRWIKPLTVDIEFYEEEDGEEALYEIACAEVHPSFGYRLDHKGQFYGSSGGRPVADSYDRRVEQTALYHDANRGDDWDPLMRIVPDEKRQGLLLVVEKGLEHLASDQYTRWYLTPDWLVEEDAISGFCRACGSKRAMAEWKL